MGRTKPTDECKSAGQQAEATMCLKETMDKEARLLCHVILKRLDKIEAKLSRLARKAKRKKRK